MKKALKLTTFVALLAIGLLSIKYTANVKTTNTATIKGNVTLSGTGIIYGGLISPGNSPGKITVTGDFTMGNTATYKCELKDLTGAGTGHDQIDVSGSITLDGTLDIILDGYTPNDNDQFDIMKYGTTLNGTFNTVNGLPSGWQIDYGVLEPNTVSIYGPNSTLPLELLNFTAIKQQKSILLKWQTASERNIDYFVIEHSTDTKHFSSIERIKMQGIKKYSFEHHTPVQGINYYRLKQVYNNGNYAYSKIKSVEVGKRKITFFPNPAKKSITFNRPCKIVIIYDISGKEIMRKEKVTSTLDISLLKPGIYIIDVNKGEYKDKIVIE